MLYTANAVAIHKPETLSARTLNVVSALAELYTDVYMCHV